MTFPYNRKTVAQTDAKQLALADLTIAKWDSETFRTFHDDTLAERIADLTGLYPVKCEELVKLARRRRGL